MSIRPGDLALELGVDPETVDLYVDQLIDIDGRRAVWEDEPETRLTETAADVIRDQVADDRRSKP